MTFQVPEHNLCIFQRSHFFQDFQVAYEPWKIEGWGVSGFKSTHHRRVKVASAELKCLSVSSALRECLKAMDNDRLIVEHSFHEQRGSDQLRAGTEADLLLQRYVHLSINVLNNIEIDHPLPKEYCDNVDFELLIIKL